MRISMYASWLLPWLAGQIFEILICCAKSTLRMSSLTTVTLSKSNVGYLAKIGTQTVVDLKGHNFAACLSQTPSRHQSLSPISMTLTWSSISAVSTIGLLHPSRNFAQRTFSKTVTKHCSIRYDLQFSSILFLLSVTYCTHSPAAFGVCLAVLIRFHSFFHFYKVTPNNSVW